MRTPCGVSSFLPASAGRGKADWSVSKKLGEGGAPSFSADFDVFPGGGELSLGREHDRQVPVHGAVPWTAVEHRPVVADGPVVVAPVGEEPGEGAVRVGVGRGVFQCDLKLG